MFLQRATTPECDIKARRRFKNGAGPKFAAAAALTAGRVALFCSSGQSDAIRVEPWSYNFVLLHPVQGVGLFVF